MIVSFSLFALWKQILNSQKIISIPLRPKESLSPHTVLEVIQKHFETLSKITEKWYNLLRNRKNSYIVFVSLELIKKH